MWHREMKWEHTVGKTPSIYLFDTGLPQNLSVKSTISVKWDEAKCNKTRCAYTCLRRK